MTRFNKTLCFSDFHGDLDTMANSFAAKGLMDYQGDVDDLKYRIKTNVQDDIAPSLEKLVIMQDKPVRLFFLGDCLDRGSEGYYIIQIFSKVRWEKFNIFPIFILGNHDLLNFLFLVNPYKIHKLYQDNGPSFSQVSDYICSMDIDKSIQGFIDLHFEEIMSLQKNFYLDGRIEFEEKNYSIAFHYKRDYSFFNKISHIDSDDMMEFVSKFNKAIGVKEEENNNNNKNFYVGWEPSGRYITNMLNEHHSDKTDESWWDIVPRDLDSEEPVRFRSLEYINILKRIERGKLIEVLPVDWRVISIVWRKHYGEYFKNVKYLFFEDSTIYVHGGISPTAMIDPLVFGPLSVPFEIKFQEPTKFMNIEIQTNRINRVVTQVLENALKDYSFENMCGAEVVDQIGRWRGSHKGFLQFGGPLWCDFEYIHSCLEWDKNTLMLGLYKQFAETHGIKRIVCGHTPFRSFGNEPEQPFKMSKILEKEINLEYICIDNCCSRSYRKDNPVLNGIEIDHMGNIISQ
jgi:hypothetical protein